MNQAPTLRRAVPIAVIAALANGFTLLGLGAGTARAQVTATSLHRADSDRRTAVLQVDLAPPSPMVWTRSPVFWISPEPSRALPPPLERVRHLPALRTSSLVQRLFTAVGSGVIGAGMGFFASQVVHGDWETGRGDDGIDRATWAAVGGSIGFALGLTVRFGGGPPAGELRRMERGRLSLRAEEMEGKALRNADEAVRLLRPEWLIQRGQHIIGETADETIQVYLDGNRLGGVSWLRQIDTQRIESLHFLDAAAATLRWGAGHSHGAILIVSG